MAMSRFVSKLVDKLTDNETQSGRDGLGWPQPGNWASENIEKLRTFAEHLEVPDSGGNSDALNSVPTPWARLLLFETALFNRHHPSHDGVLSQWRGLMGVIALADLLGINLEAHLFDLTKSDSKDYAILRSFLDVPPSKSDEWNSMTLIYADKKLLGGTSPRTLVFTAVDHECPASVPFLDKDGRLMDPVEYYKALGQLQYCALLRTWIKSLNQKLLGVNFGGKEWSPRNNPLKKWQDEIDEIPGLVAQAQIAGVGTERKGSSEGKATSLADADEASTQVKNHFSSSHMPYKLLESISTAFEDAAGSSVSDLLLEGRNDVMIGFAPSNGSYLATNQGRIAEGKLRVWRARWVKIDKVTFPDCLRPIPENIDLVENPAKFFEPALIRVHVPENSQNVFTLQPAEKGFRFLYPLNPEILKYLTPEQIKAGTTIKVIAGKNIVRAEVKVPLVNQKFVVATKDYDVTDRSQIISQFGSASLAAWPNFHSEHWHTYYYYKSAVAGEGKEVDFDPLDENWNPMTGESDNFRQTWYKGEKPVNVFRGSIRGHEGGGLLFFFPKGPNEGRAPQNGWHVAVDLGSTHTRAFYYREDPQNPQPYAKGAEVKPIRFAARSLAVTDCNADMLKNNFLAQEGTLKPYNQEELRTLAMIPILTPTREQNWLPSLGYVFQHWIHQGYVKDHLRHNLKWNGNSADPGLRSYIHCLLRMIAAEALSKGATVKSIRWAYPSVFPESLQILHKNLWNACEREVFGQVLHEDADSKGITEAEAVCSYLVADDDATPVMNAIAFDVGGSTTDMSIWANNRRHVQQSIKLAADILDRYIRTPSAEEFRTWLGDILASEPYSLPGTRMEDGLMFKDILAYFEYAGQGKNELSSLLQLLHTSEEAAGLRGHISFLFGTIFYYGGLLTRSARLQDQTHFNLHVCGKGGQVLKWIDEPEELATQMFIAGLTSSSKPEDQREYSATLHFSNKPKAEVGRGLLALPGRPPDRDNRTGQASQITHPHPFAKKGNSPEDKPQDPQAAESSDGIKNKADSRLSVATFGEDGYQGFKWDDELTADRLATLDPASFPADLSGMNQFHTFYDAFTTGPATKGTAEALGLTKVDGDELHARLKQRLFGNMHGAVVTPLRDPAARRAALIESLFITETKVLACLLESRIDLFEQ